MNKKVPGKFKDECGGEPISEFCALRAKLYAFKKDGEEEKRYKGVKKPIVSKSIHLEQGCQTYGPLRGWIRLAE